MQFVIALLLLFAGIVCTIALRGEPFCALGTLFRRRSSAGGLSPFAALACALCGTLGVGSIGAVVSAVQQGGAGVLAWLWLGAVTGCSLKYAEVRITMKHRRGDLSGAMVALHEKSPLLGRMYALLCLPVALIGMGNLSQVQALSQTLADAAQLSRLLIGCAVLALLTLMLGDIRRIGRIASIVLPAVGAVYVAVCMLSLFRMRGALPAVFSDILRELAHPHAPTFVLGIARGLFISEAGMGTAAFAHSQSRADPRLQGALGVCEVLFSTFLATLTALMVLCSGVPLNAQAACHAFCAAVGPGGKTLLCLMMTFFALSTLPVWWFYGKQCVQYLFQGKLMLRLYTAIFLCIAFTGCLFPLSGAWRAADAVNLLLCLPSMMMLLLHRAELCSILQIRQKQVILKSSGKSSHLR